MSARALSNGCKSLTQPIIGKCTADGKAKSGGNHRQSTGLTCRILMLRHMSEDELINWMNPISNSNAEDARSYTMPMTA
jgi:hypothetical protein